jgi:hypothetical protein
MVGQLQPPIDAGRGPEPSLSPDLQVGIWLDMLNAGHKLLLSGLRQQGDSEEAVRDAYRAWYAEQMADHDRTINRMLRRMQQRQTTDAS